MLIELSAFLIFSLSPAKDKLERDQYHSALQAFREDRWDDGILLMENFVKTYSRSDLADNAIYWMAQGYLQKNEPGLARAELERIIKVYPKGDRAKRALARLQILEKDSKP